MTSEGSAFKLESNGFSTIGKIRKTGTYNRKRTNFLHLLQNRELQEHDWRSFSKKTQIFHSTLQRLDVVKELEGHSGCVNCVEFNGAGDLLLSGSDDFAVILWDVHHRKLLNKFQTGHRGNIFSVKFLPNTNDTTVITGAADHRVEVRHVTADKVLRVCSCHSERVKRVAPMLTSPSVFFSASEDGTVMQHDMREKHTCSATPSVLVDLKHYCGRLAECKCVAAHPVKSEFLAVGANDPFIRIYDRRMIKPTTVQNSTSTWDLRNFTSRSTAESSEDNLPPGCVQYFVPGHLPAKMKEYSRKYRSLSTTYLTYSSDGVHLLANLGGDHVYLFDTLRADVPQEFKCPAVETTKSVGAPSAECSPRESTNGHTMKHFSFLEDEDISLPTLDNIPSVIQSLREKAQLAFKYHEFTKALQFCNLAILYWDNVAHFYLARAAVFLKRKWDGDTYSAFRDSCKAIKIDPNCLKAKIRLIQCLSRLGRSEEVNYSLGELLELHPQLSTNAVWVDFKREVLDAASKNGCPTTSCCSGSASEEDSMLGESLNEKELRWRQKARDYDMVYNGHCNTTTDIKEAVFVGRNEDFIAAGSDDGNLFIWNRRTSNVVRVIEADRSIVNCVQSHPNVAMLATSGIETVVKLWAPSDKAEDASSVDSERVASITEENQKRMSTDPMEMMFLQMGEFLEGGVLANRRMDMDDDDDINHHNSIQCMQT